MDCHRAAAYIDSRPHRPLPTWLSDIVHRELCSITAPTTELIQLLIEKGTQPLYYRPPSDAATAQIKTSHQSLCTAIKEPMDQAVAIMAPSARPGPAAWCYHTEASQLHRNDTLSNLIVVIRSQRNALSGPFNRWCIAMCHDHWSAPDQASNGGCHLCVAANLSAFVFPACILYRLLKPQSDYYKPLVVIERCIGTVKVTMSRSMIALGWSRPQHRHQTWL